jgi:hypothetical protein
MKIIYIILIIFLILIVIYQNYFYYKVNDPIEKYNVDVEKKLYCFWTGDNEMSNNRKSCLDNLYKTGFEIILITNKNLSNYILKNEPLHESFTYLSETHKADYLRTYFMHFYGGAYSDIKNITGSWNEAYSDLINDKTKYANGVKEVGEYGVAVHYNHSLNKEIRENWYKLIGNGGYIFRKNTPFTTEWYNTMLQKMNEISEQLKKYPSTNPQQVYSDTYEYPLRWAELLGEIFHPICYKYNKNILQTVPPHIYTDYR